MEIEVENMQLQNSVQTVSRDDQERLTSTELSSSGISSSQPVLTPQVLGLAAVNV